MIWVCLYILIASFCVFGLVLLTEEAGRKRNYLYDDFPAILCGILWPIAGPIYTAYLLALIYRKEESE